MSLRINTNIHALGALRSLGNTMDQYQLSIQKLSTGLRINSAGDDPAGLIISESLRTQVLGIDQATRNAQDAVNMTKTAEAALGEVQTLIRNMRSIAVHSANTAVVDATMLQANQSQIRNALQSINRIAEQTSWGTKKLLDGTAGAQANVTRASDIGSIYVGGTFNGDSVATGAITMQKVTAAERAIVTLGGTFTNSSTIITTSGNFVINGYSFSTDGTESVQSLVSKINAMSNTTGVTAQVTGSGPVSIALSSTTFGLNSAINYFDPGRVLHNASSAQDTGLNGVYNVTIPTTNGIATVQFTGGQGPGVSGLQLSDSWGNTISVTEQGNSGLASATQVGVMTAGSVQFHIGAGSNQSVAFSMPNVYSNRLGTGVVSGKALDNIDVTSQQGAQDAIKIIDQAVVQLAQWRGDIGAFQVNFLESTVRSLGVAKENIQASESQIRDVDMAQEMTNYTRLQILQQSGMSMLAQANQAPQSVLSLLQR
ncbi:MAG: hypothetical protein J0L72_09185 [Armatimonadetes bacterium]|nr:hypothetical protein [Armatimonadota bacterium]